MGRIVDRFLILLYCLMTATLLFWLIVMTMQWVSMMEAEGMLYLLYTEPSVRFGMMAGGLILLLICARLIYIALRSTSETNVSVDQRTEIGDIRISLDTIHHLSVKAATKIRGLSEIKASVRITDAGIEVALRAKVDGIKPIPELTDEIQRSVKSYVEEITGLPVPYVSVYIANVSSAATGTRTRLQ